MLRADVDLDVSIDTEDVLQAHRKRVKNAADLGFAISQEEVPVERGTLQQSGFAPEWRGETLVFGYTADHAEPMERGTRPFEPEVEPLERWAERIGKDAAFGRWVAQVKIPQQGITAQPYLKPSAQRMARWLNNHGLDL